MILDELDIRYISQLIIVRLDQQAFSAPDFIHQLKQSDFSYFALI